MNEVIANIVSIAESLGLSQLPNPYNLDANTDIFLKNGFGIAIRGADYVLPNGQVNRQLDLILTVKNMGNVQSVALIESNSTALTGNAFEIIYQLSSLSSNYSYSSDTGVEVFGGENGEEYLTFTISLNVQYIDRDLLAQC